MIPAKTELEQSEIALLHDIRDRKLAGIDLTPKEILVARLMLKDASTEEMARILCNIKSTIERQIKKVYQKSGTHSRANFISWVFPT